MRPHWCTLRAITGSSAGTPSQSRTAPAAALETARGAVPRPAAPARAPGGSFQRVSPVPQLEPHLLLPLLPLSPLPLPPLLLPLLLLSLSQLSRLVPPALL